MPAGVGRHASVGMLDTHVDAACIQDLKKIRCYLVFRCHLDLDPDLDLRSKDQRIKDAFIFIFILTLDQKIKMKKIN